MMPTSLWFFGLYLGTHISKRMQSANVSVKMNKA